MTASGANKSQLTKWREEWGLFVNEERPVFVMLQTEELGHW